MSKATINNYHGQRDVYPIHQIHPIHVHAYVTNHTKLSHVREDLPGLIHKNLEENKAEHHVQDAVPGAMVGVFPDAHRFNNSVDVPATVHKQEHQSGCEMIEMQVTGAAVKHHLGSLRIE